MRQFRFTAMFESSVKVFVFVLETYAVVGLAFAALFVSIGVRRLDSEAQESGLGFRLLIMPGVAAFWPLLLYRWIARVSEPPVERNPHRIG